MTKDKELLKLCTESLENLLGYFGTPVAKLIMKGHWTPDHDLIIKTAKEALSAVNASSVERDLPPSGVAMPQGRSLSELDGQFGVRLKDLGLLRGGDEPCVIGPAHMLRSLKKEGVIKDSPPLDPRTWNLATENAAVIAEMGQPGAYAAAIARMIRREKMTLPQAPAAPARKKGARS